MSTTPTSDPSMAICPDFSSSDYQEDRQSVMDLGEGITAEQAAVSLTKAWKIQNEREKQRWQQRIEAQAATDAEAARIAQEDNERRTAAEREEQEAADKEDRRKNRVKHLPIQVGVGLPERPLTTICSSSYQAMKRMEYVGIGPFTNRGIDKTVAPVGSLASKSLTVTRDEEGNMVFVPAHDLRASSVNIKDEDLTWDEFSVGTLRMVAVMEELNWPSSHIRMFGDFWGGLHQHPFNTAVDPTGIDRRALLIYQAEARRSWYQALHSHGKAFDLSVVNEPLLQRARDKAIKEFQLKELKEVEAKVRTFVWLSLGALANPFSPPPLLTFYHIRPSAPTAAHCQRRFCRCRLCRYRASCPHTRRCPLPMPIPADAHTCRCPHLPMPIADAITCPSMPRTGLIHRPSLTFPRRFGAGTRRSVSIALPSSRTPQPSLFASSAQIPLSLSLPGLTSVSSKAPWP